jgi:hypothetical protein
VDEDDAGTCNPALARACGREAGATTPLHTEPRLRSAGHQAAGRAARGKKIFCARALCTGPFGERSRATSTAQDEWPGPGAEVHFAALFAMWIDPETSNVGRRARSLSEGKSLTTSARRAKPRSARLPVERAQSLLASAADRDLRKPPIRGRPTTATRVARLGEIKRRREAVRASCRTIRAAGTNVSIRPRWRASRFRELTSVDDTPTPGACLRLPQFLSGQVDGAGREALKHGWRAGFSVPASLSERPDTVAIRCFRD